MKCEEVINLMQRELDGDLNAMEKKKLFHHLSSCYDCQALFERFKTLSFQLEALPKVNPPYSIVDKVLPTLDQVEHSTNGKVSSLTEKAGLKKKGIKKSKKWWIPSIAVAAVLFVALIINDQSNVKMNQLSSMSKEESFDNANRSNQMADQSSSQDAPAEAAEEVQQYSIAKTPEASSKASEGEEAASQEGVPEARIMQEPVEENSVPSDESENTDGATGTREEKQEQTMLTVEEENPLYVSPDGVYTAHEGLGGGDILIQKEDRPYYITKNQWEEFWEVESIEWVANEELYYVLYHSEQDERQYWIVYVDERTEEQLDEPYHQE
jgi:hypothetical protein